MISYFSADYQEARQKFLAASKAAGADLCSMQNPNTGPDGKSLYTDVAVLGPRQARSILVLQSGTHGVEGFAGSAIQTALLHDAILPQLTSSLRLVLIHAINPWGFAHLRRVNEDNVDVNRNFIDRSKPYPTNTAYQQLAPILEPNWLSPFSRWTSLARFLVFGATHGFKFLRSAVTGGQYSNPDGLFFGGHFDVWSNKVLHRVLNDYVAGAEQVAFIDFHTGLGPPGHAEMILNEPKGSPTLRRAREWWGDRVKSTKADEAVSADLVGTLKVAVADALHGSKVTAGSLEFGTLASHVVLWALIAENWLYHHADPDDPRRPIVKARLRNAFFTDTDGWKDAVWSQGKEVILQAFGGLSTKAPS